MFVKLHLSNNKTVIIGVIYRHPGYNYTDFLNCFEKLLYNLNLSNKTYFVCGDFNINYSKQQQNSVYINSIASTGSQQLITSPTRIKSAPNASSLLDHLYTNHLTDQVLVKIISHDVTDHLPFIAVIDNHPPKIERQCKYKKRDMRNFNKNEFLDYLSLHMNSISSLDANESFDMFIDVMTNSINKFAPFRSLTKREIKLKAKPWITPNISKLIRKKNRLYKKFVRSKSNADQRAFKVFSNHLNHMKEQSKRHHYDNVINNSSKNSKLIWKTVNDIVNLKDKKGTDIKLITTQDGKSISDPTRISEEFNTFFASIGQSTSNSLTSNVPFSLSHIPNNSKSFFLKPFTAREIKAHIQQLNTSKSVRPNDPPIKFIKMAAEVISPTLAKIFNQCIEQQTFPNSLKTACVIPIHKRGNKTSCNNFRPISLISPFSKLFEKCLLTQLSSFFQSNSLISPNQFGFKENTSTEIAVSKIYDEYVQNIEDKKITCSVYLDISKAFDTVNHQILLKKLDRYGVRGLPLGILKSYLSNRYQYTSISGSFSSCLPIFSGVPQGSVLGPFLFSVFINDLPLITNMKSTLFADDACLSYSHNCILQIERFVNKELHKVNLWLLSNKLKLNIDKTNYMLVHRQNTIQTHNISIAINNTRIKEKDQVKYLGVIIDNHLSWKPQVKNIKSKISKCTWALTKLRPYTYIHTLKLIYYTLAYSHLQYCIGSWGGACGALDSLLVKQKLLARTILKKPYCSPSAPLFSSLQLLKMHQIYEYKVGVLMHKHSTGALQLPQHLLLVSNLHHHNTRSSSNKNYVLPVARINLKQTSLTYRGPEYWNKIPPKIRALPHHCFKQTYKQHLLAGT